MAQKRLAIPDDAVLVVFGATGDLAKRKLLPGLFHLAVAGLTPRRYRIVGSAPPGTIDTEAFGDLVHQALEDFGRKEVTDGTWGTFGDALSFAPAAMHRSETHRADQSVRKGPSAALTNTLLFRSW